MIEAPILTFDCDWAPNFIIEYVTKILIRKKIKSTWFITNDLPIIRQMSKNPLFELGLHPNFSPNSTQGEDPDSILKNLKKIVPEAKSIRTHALIQSSYLLYKFPEYGIENDLSLLLPKTANISPHYLKFLNLYRFPYFWEDDLEMLEGPNWMTIENSFNLKGLKIFNFHPIHICLNSKNMNNYDLIKQKIGMSSLNTENIKLYVNKTNLGTGFFFEKITSYLSDKETFKIQDLHKIYEKSLMTSNDDQVK